MSAHGAAPRAIGAALAAIADKPRLGSMDAPIARGAPPWIDALDGIRARGCYHKVAMALCAHLRAFTTATAIPIVKATDPNGRPALYAPRFALSGKVTRYRGEPVGFAPALYVDVDARRAVVAAIGIDPGTSLTDGYRAIVKWANDHKAPPVDGAPDNGASGALTRALAVWTGRPAAKDAVKAGKNIEQGARKLRDLTQEEVCETLARSDAKALARVKATRSLL